MRVMLARQASVSWGTSVVLGALALMTAAPMAVQAQTSSYSFTRIADTIHNDAGLNGVVCTGLNNQGTVVVTFAPSGSGTQQVWKGDGQSFAPVAISSGLCPSINDVGEIAYFVNNYPSLAVTSLVRNNNGSQTILARTDVAPTLGSGNYLPSLNDSGNAVYLSSSFPNAGIYLGPAGTTVYNASTDPQPLNTYITASMNNSNTVVFYAQRIVGNPPVQRSGIYRGSSTPLIEDGDVVSVGTIRILLERPVINNEGTVAFNGSTDGSSKVYTTSDGDNVALVGTGSIQRLSLNDSGTVAYRRAMFNIGGVSQGSGIFVGRPGAIDRKVIGLGDALDGSVVHDCFLWEESLNNHGQVAFWALLADGRRGIYRADPRPVLTNLSPSSAAVGSAALTLTVNGSQFVSGSQVRWNGIARTTTYVNEGQLRAAIPASDLSATGAANVTVVNPAPVAGTSNSLTFTIGPTMALDKSSLVFAAVTTGASFQYQTSPQMVRVRQTGSGTVTWTAAASHPWLNVTPSSGTGSADLSISVAFAPGLPPAGSLTGSITVTFTGAMNAPGPVAAKLNLLSSASEDPFGVVDTPYDNTTGVTGSVPFTGWMLDDVEAARVMICRDAVGAEIAPVDPNCAGRAQIFVGFPVFIDLARPDVAAAYPEIPLNSRAGWGLMVLTNMLPSQGNGTFRFYFWGQDREGHTKLLGIRTISCDNAHATKPFGAIDTPTQGGTATGSSFANFGWALTPWPKTIPRDGSTIEVLVDGAPVGHVSYDLYRPDIATLFPGLNNSNGAIGFRALDTANLANGTHTIAWIVSDDQGASEGIGSRYFAVSNGAGTVNAFSQVTRPYARSMRPGATPGDGSHQRVARLSGRLGWDLAAPLRTFALDGEGRILVHSEEVNRIELRFEPGAEGGLRTHEGLVPLPIGARLDRATGIFTWGPGVGYVGNYDLEFAARDQTVTRVRVVLHPKGSGAVGAQVVIDTPRMQQDVGQPFELAGWAADLSAAQGTGIATLHAWAYPLRGGPPVFLGATTYGGARPDVAAAHGEAFEASGFSLSVQGLTPGNYDVAVFAWSTERAAFVPAQVVRLTVRP